MLHFFLTQESASSSLGPAAHQLSLNPAEPPTHLEKKKSACAGSREKIPRATHLAQHQNTCTLPASARDSNPSGSGQHKLVQGRAAMLLDPPGPTKSWQHFPYNSSKHLAKKSVSCLRILSTEHQVLVKKDMKRHRPSLLTAQILSEEDSCKTSVW